MVVTHAIKPGNFKSPEQSGYFYPNYKEFAEKCSLTVTFFFLFFFGWILFRKLLGLCQRQLGLNSANGKNKVLTILELPWRPAVAGRSPQHLDDSQQRESSLLNGNFLVENGTNHRALMTHMEIWINELIFKIHLCSSFGD